MGVPTSEVGYTSVTTGRGDHEIHKGHVVALAKKILLYKQHVRIKKDALFTSIIQHDR
jgi:hypothetical protein